MSKLDELFRGVVQEELRAALAPLAQAIAELQARGNVAQQLSSLLGGSVAPVGVPIVKRGPGRPRKNPLPALVAASVEAPRVKRKYKKRAKKVEAVVPKLVKAQKKAVKQAKKIVKAAKKLKPASKPKVVKPAKPARKALSPEQRAMKQAADRARRAAKKLSSNGVTPTAKASPPKAAIPAPVPAPPAA